ncbi:hypothetical protein SAICODRAFT_29755 [Saitoella complicata NRRL Y-17804]|uniref:uncharacterized protein n=1 Tax=Saitoella complicata (strain BCRC 22490 / CBS 7301 / JCM 7358 / NBRC 10748 / NRRL Y-17804) TaxID=698492 RepID=UPI000867C987|nr:uncharacterized protein SAICODRAFT_29755 [Saitoella complicata NRRL Y-17804]ODQ54239.1 hypothetical protein SAICODRAFT_29755 [Saitoella complicata NRRL Y-17804]
MSETESSALTAIVIKQNASIESTVDRALAILLSDDASVPSATGNAITIQGAGSVTTKAITIVEIIKRRLEEAQLKWWQYNELDGVEPPKTEADEIMEQGRLSGLSLEKKTEHKKPRLTMTISLTPLDGRGKASQSSMA